MLCGKKFYREHEPEIKELSDQISKLNRDEDVLKDYIQDFFDHLNGGRRGIPGYGTYFIEQTEEQKRGAKKLIKEITGKEVEDLKLIELEQIKQGLEERKEKLRQLFTERIESLKKEENEKV